MKNTAIVFGLLILLLVVSPVNAREIEPQRGVKEEVEDVEDVDARREVRESSSPQESPVSNQKQDRETERFEKREDSDNSDEIENEEEDDESEATEEARTDMRKRPSPRSAVAREHMSIVSLKVEELLANRTAQGGIGEQVRVIARQQQLAQQDIEDEIEAVDDRSGLVKRLIGPKFKALKNVEDQIQANKERINLLQALEDQLTDEAEIAEVHAVIEALTDQNAILQDRVSEEKNTRSLLGWLIKRFQ